MGTGGATARAPFGGGLTAPRAYGRRVLRPVGAGRRRALPGALAGSRALPVSGGGVRRAAERLERAGGRASERTGGRPAGRAERLSGGARRGETRSPRRGGGGGGDRYGRHGRGDGTRARAVDPGIGPALAVPPPPSPHAAFPGAAWTGRAADGGHAWEAERPRLRSAIALRRAGSPARARLLFPAQPVHRSRSPVSPRHATPPPGAEETWPSGAPRARTRARITERPTVSAWPCDGRAARVPPSPAIPGPARCRRAGDPRARKWTLEGKPIKSCFRGPEVAERGQALVTKSDDRSSIPGTDS